MTVGTFNFTTGPATLPDIGTLFYNGCTFSPLFASTVSGTAVPDAAGRTIKQMDYTILVDGYVTKAAGLNDIAPTMETLQVALEAQGGKLIYEGRGFDLTVNAAGATLFGNAARDVAWGPVPQLIEFQPLGAGQSAKVKWVVTVHVVVGPLVGKSGLLQFNCETTVSYSEDYYSSLSVRGTMEIPLTRATQGSRTLKSTVDDRRNELDARIFAGIDLSRFRVLRRNYNVSRDKRTMEFDVEVEEKPYMDLPPGCTIARGTFSVKPVTQGKGLVNWACTLRVSYVVQRGAPRRLPYWAFLTLLRLRMNQSILGLIPELTGKQQLALAKVSKKFLDTASEAIVPPNSDLRTIHLTLLKQQSARTAPNTAIQYDFSFEEGLYLDSKTVSFSASWTITASLDTILAASGLWRKIPENDNRGGNLWAASMKNISGSRSWLPNKLDPTQDVIVDFGGG